MKKYVIGIDYGTLSARAVLFDLKSGEEVAEAVYTYPHGVMDFGQPKYALQHPDDYLEGLKTTVAGLGVDPQEVGGLGIDFTCCTMLPVDENLEPLCKKYENPHAYVKLWKHHGAVEQANRFDSFAKGEEWFKVFGGSSSSEWLFPKIMETLDKAPEVFNDTYRFLEAADWLSWRMTGKETHNAAMAGLKNHWSKEYGYPSNAFLKKVHPGLDGIVGTKVSPIVNTVEETAGVLNEQGAAMTGLLPGTPVALPMVDAHAPLAALNITEEGELLAVIGTSTCHVINTAAASEVPGITAYVEEGMLPGLVTYESGQAGVGDCFDWFTKNCVPAAYTEEAAAGGMNIHALLREKAMRLKLGENRLLALDWWSGNRSILKNDALTGMILGLNMQTKPEEIYRALIEATAYGTRRIIENYEEHGIPVKSICAAGGIARKDPMLMQIYADVTGKEFRVAESTQAAARGSALYAAVAAGACKDIMEAAKRYALPDAGVYQPDPEAGRIYDGLYREYKKLHDYFGLENHVMEELGK
ncbi:MAG: ribulokinase [Clostridia bacterium]|nr:ribulokinase [Clostridia bacterium]